MGYCTRYSLSWEVPPDFVDKSRCDHDIPEGANFCPVCGLPNTWLTPDEAIGDYIESFDNMCYAIDRHGDSDNTTKWYDYESDMRSMSQHFKGVLFTLYGEGEEAGDIWKKYFLDGKCQIAEASIVIDDFDPDKLK